LIFVTLGTDEHPFPRALDAVSALRTRAQLVIQYGHTPPRLEWEQTEWVQFMEYDAVLEQMTAAEAVVCHAGVGTIMTALGLHIRPVVVPRLSHHGEHVDDHQLQIMQALRDRDLVVPCMPGVSLAEVLAEPNRTSVSWSRNHALAAAVAEAVGVAA
jgi:UDP-N-acetylglucosamine transferase subunit ALG13